MSVMGGHVSIADHAVIGGAAAIHQFVRIGRAAMVGGVSGVEADVIPFGSVLGNRARLAGLNVIGLKRRGFDKAQIQLLHNAFRDLFRHEGVFAQRLAAVRARYGDEALVAEVLAFIDAPEPSRSDPRGVAGGGGPPDAWHPGGRRTVAGPGGRGGTGGRARRVHDRAGGFRRPGGARALAARVRADPRRGTDHCRVARAWLPGSGAGRAGAAALAARPPSGCRGCAHSGPHRPRGVRRRRWAVGCRRAGVCRGGVPRRRRARDPQRGAWTRGAAVARRSGCGVDGGHSPRHCRCPRAGGDRCRAGLRGAAGDGAGGRGGRGHRCDAGALCAVGATGTRRGAGEAGEAWPGSPRRPADHRTRDVRGAAEAGLRGVAFEAGGTILAERDAAVAAADAAGLFLLGLGPDELSARGENT